MEPQRINADSLLQIIGITPADNIEKFDREVNTLSSSSTQMVNMSFKWENCLESIENNPFMFGPYSFWAGFQKNMLKTYVTDPIRATALSSVLNGTSPDLFSAQNERIETAYAKLLHQLTSHFITKEKFDPDIAREVSSSPHGQELLSNYMNKFKMLENAYTSQGLTRLCAMKEILKCLMMLITESPLKKPNGKYFFEKKENKVSFKNYLKDIKTTVENLYTHDAFEIKKFSESVTNNSIGFSPYEVVEDSYLHCVQLRHYHPHRGVTANKKVLYITTPLINKPEIFDIAEGKSVIEGMLKEGFTVYMVDHCGIDVKDAELGLDFFGKTIHDKFLEIIKQRHPRWEIYAMAYCMAGTLLLPYLARRAEELTAKKRKMDVRKVALLASPVTFDDDKSGHGPMRKYIKKAYDPILMRELFGMSNVPPHVIENGMHEIQAGVQYYVIKGFYQRAKYPNAVEDAAPFLYWLTHGTKFAFQAHTEWIQKFFMENQLAEGTYCLSSTNTKLNNKPVDMDSLKRTGVSIFDYRGQRDPIAPASSCIASELWGQNSVKALTRGGMNRTIEKNIGHIFVVSSKLLVEFLKKVNSFYRGETIVNG